MAEERLHPDRGQGGQATAELPQGRIAFRRWPDDDQTRGAIFTVRSDGTGEQQVTDPDPRLERRLPDWSPDGRLIAYQHCPSPPNYEGKPCSVWTVDADGGTPRRVDFRCRRGGCDTRGPAWTPDGRLIATLGQGRIRKFGVEPQRQQSSLEIIDPRSGRQRTIHKRSGWAGGTENAQVSPDGRTVLYTRDNSVALGASARAGAVRGRHRRLRSPPSGVLGTRRRRPRQLLTRRRDPVPLLREQREQAIGLLDRAPRRHRPQATDALQDRHARTESSYSPDGDWIVYGSDYGNGKADLYVMRANGTGQRQLTRSKWWDSAPDWGPTPR